MTYHALEHRRSRVPGLVDPRSIKAAWYLAGEISVANCLAAYQAKGMETFAASKINLANPGTYDLSDGGSPTWDSNNGWMLSNSYLYSACPVGNKGVTYIARVKPLNADAYQTVIGGNSANGPLSWDISATTLIPRLLKQNVAWIGSGTAGFSANVDTVIAASYSSIGEWAHYLNGAANGSGTTDLTLDAGTLQIGTQATNLQRYYGNILGVAIYNVVLTADQVAAVSDSLAAV